jgi:hypothetical protein
MLPKNGMACLVILKIISPLGNSVRMIGINGQKVFLEKAKAIG